MSQFLPLDDEKVYIKNIGKIPYLKSFDGNYVDQMFKASLLCEYEEGETIIAEGSFDRRIYFLLLGELKVMKGGTEIASISDYGEIFGELAMLNEETRSASVIAVKPCYCLSIDAAFLDMLEMVDRVACFAVLHRICAQVLSNRLRKTTEELARVEREIESLKTDIEKI